MDSGLEWEVREQTKPKFVSLTVCADDVMDGGLEWEVWKLSSNSGLVHIVQISLE